MMKINVKMDKKEEEVKNKTNKKCINKKIIRRLKSTRKG